MLSCYPIVIDLEGDITGAALYSKIAASIPQLRHGKFEFSLYFVEKEGISCSLERSKSELLSPSGSSAKLSMRCLKAGAENCAGCRIVNDETIIELVDRQYVLCELPSAVEKWTFRFETPSEAITTGIICLEIFLTQLKITKLPCMIV